MQHARRLFLFVAFFVTMGALTLPCRTQAADETVDPLQALRVYPAETRAATAEILQHPEVLLELEQYRQVARAKFNKLLASYPQKTQETVRQLVPYRKLWRALGAFSGSEQETQDLLKSYPKDVQDLAKDLLKNSPDILGKVVSLEKETYQHFFKIISGLDPQTQDAFKKVGQQSGILSVLSKALDLPSEGKEPSADLRQKSQNLANQLLALNKGAQSVPSERSVHSSEASATLQAARDEFNKGQNRQIDQDPYSENAVQATVTYSPDLYYPNAIGVHYYPYWY